MPEASGKSSGESPAGSRSLTPLDLFNTTAKFTQTALDLWIRHVTRDPGSDDDPLRVGEAHAAIALRDD